MCLNYIKMKVDLPMVVLIDNIGAIEMLDSKTGQCKTKHIDTRFHWIKQYVDENRVKVDYIKSENNVSFFIHVRKQFHLCFGLVKSIFTFSILNRAIRLY